MSEIKDLRVTQYDNPKKTMYFAKELLLTRDKINITGTTNSATIVARTAEGLVRFGYVTYENVKTETIIENNEKRIIRFIVTIKKTNNFDKLYKENEENRKKKEEERKKMEESKK